MKSTGIVRRLDVLGRIVIPKEIRKKLFGENLEYPYQGLGEGEPFEIFLDGEDIILRKYKE
jgi:AbrB family transcriptional regulator, transcriptional pleiotropic regulator of transition state genes